MKKLKIFTLATLLCLVGVAQAKVIRGTVTDQTGETIISASVIVKALPSVRLPTLTVTMK